MDAPKDPPGEVFAAVLAAARLGADWAWTALYRDLAPAVLRYLRARGVPDAEDVLGEVFVRVVRSIRTFEGTEEELRAWVFTIARNTMRDHFRKQSYRRHGRIEDAADAGTLPPDPETVEDVAIGRMEAAGVLAMVDELSDDQREVVLLRLVAGLPIGEVAEIIGKTPGAVKALQHRALRTLAHRIRRWPSEDA